MSRALLTIVAWLALAAPVAAQVGVRAQDLILIPTGQTVADNGGGTAASGTVTVAGRSYVPLTCSDANGCTMSMSETGADNGQALLIVNVSANTATFADSAGVLELSAGAAVALAQYEGVFLQYASDRWIEVARTSGTGGGGASTSASFVTKVAEGGLSNEFALGSLATGILKNTTTTGVPTIAVAGTDYYAPGSTDVAITDGGTGVSLADPNADKILFWDDSEGEFRFLTIGTNLSTSADVLNATAGAGGYATIQNEGSGLTARTTVNFIGSAITCADNAGATRTDCTVTADTCFIGITIDGGGSAITTGGKGFAIAPCSGTITKATLISNDASATAGSIVIDVWKDSSTYPPDNADSITASAPPTLSAANKSVDTTLSGWTTSVTTGDNFGFYVDSSSTVTRVMLVLEVTK